jgi:transposase
VSFAIVLSDEQWELIADLFDPPGRRGAPAQISRRVMIDAMLFIGRTGIQWRYLPERYPPWTAVWCHWPDEFVTPTGFCAHRRLRIATV